MDRLGTGNFGLNLTKKIFYWYPLILILNLLNKAFEFILGKSYRFNKGIYYLSNGYHFLCS